MGQIDKVLIKRVSKKLFVFGVATVLVAVGQLTSSDWVTIATVYIGTQGVVDAVAKLKANN
jgi:urocanate hydratase